MIIVDTQLCKLIGWYIRLKNRRYFKLKSGQALLYGPGSIHHAHSRTEKIGVAELKEAVEAYKTIAKSCLGRPPAV